MIPGARASIVGEDGVDQLDWIEETAPCHVALPTPLPS